MLSSITPLGERGRRRRWGTTVTAHVVAATLGGAAVGALAGSIGWLLLRDVSWDGRLAFLVVLLAGGLALDWAQRVPGPRRQVDESWLDRYRGWVYGVGFGSQLGTGVATIVTTSAVYVTLLAACLAPSVTWALLIGTAFGALRGAPTLLTARIHSPTQLARFHFDCFTLLE